MTAGFEVAAEAESGEDAVAPGRRRSARLVLMDINLPGINGIEATRRIRADASRGRGHPPVDLLRGRPPADAREVGALAYVHKEDFGPGARPRALGRERTLIA